MRITASRSTSRRTSDLVIELLEVPDLIIEEAVRYINSESTLEMANIELRLFAMIELMLDLEKPTITGGIPTEMTQDEVYECITADMYVWDVYKAENKIILAIP